MAAEVRSLGYVVISAGDLDAWERFGTELIGLQVAERTPDRLRLRNDEKAYRLDIRRGEAEGVTVLGWEVEGAAQLAELVARLKAAGYDVTRGSREFAQERGVFDLVSFTDPDGMTIELFYGQMCDKRRFVSPTGARFLTGEGGLGHVFQLVNEEEPHRALYLDILGFKLSDYIDFGPIYGTFTHCNPRHHSYAFAPVPNAPKGIGHIMFEVDDIDIVGRAYDKVLKEGAPPSPCPSAGTRTTRCCRSTSTARPASRSSTARAACSSTTPPGPPRATTCPGSGVTSARSGRSRITGSVTERT